MPEFVFSSLRWNLVYFGDPYHTFAGFLLYGEDRFSDWSSGRRNFQSNLLYISSSNYKTLSQTMLDGILCHHWSVNPTKPSLSPPISSQCVLEAVPGEYKSFQSSLSTFLAILFLIIVLGWVCIKPLKSFFPSLSFFFRQLGWSHGSVT